MNTDWGFSLRGSHLACYTRIVGDRAGITADSVQHGAAADRLKCQAVVVLGISLGYALSLTVVLTPIASRISCSRPTPTVW
jgi:hypothetical protein